MFVDFFTGADFILSFAAELDDEETIAYEDSIANTFYVGLVKAHSFIMLYKLLNMVPEKKRKTLKKSIIQQSVR